MRKSVKKLGVGIAVVVAIAATAVVMSQDKATDFHEKYAGTDLESDVKGMERAGTYTGYLSSYDNAVCPDKSVEIDLFDYTSAKDVETYSSYEGADKSLYTGVDSSVTWQIDVPESGFYNLYA